MALFRADAGASRPIEYSVYVYFGSRTSQKNDYWEMKSVSNDVGDALAEAKRYHLSRQFSKVEIKKKYFDPRRAHHVEKTLKIFKSGSGKGVRVFGTLVLGFLVGAAGIFLGWVVVDPL